MVHSYLYPDGEPSKLGADVMGAYAEHFANALYLRHMAKQATSFEGRAIASAELTMAEHVLARCHASRSFELTTATAIATDLRTSFKPVLPPRVRPVLIERPDTRKRRAVLHTKRNALPKHVAVWPVMRTRGNVPFGLIG